MERSFLKLYRWLLPARLRRKIPQDLKDRLLVSMMLLSRRDLTMLRMRRAAAVAAHNADCGRAVLMWQNMATMSSQANIQLLDGTLVRTLGQIWDMPKAQLTETDLSDLTDDDLDAVLTAADPLMSVDAKRKLNYTKTELVRARLAYAVELHGQGHLRASREQLSRAIEAIPDQRVFKKDRPVIDAVRLYVEQALTSEVPTPAAGVPILGGKPLRIVICLDVLKVSDVHTHARVVFAICRNLMRLNPNIETHIVVSNERFTVTTPIVSASFDPRGETAMLDQARKALPDEFGKRFFVHVFKGIGLAGLVDTCRGIITLEPDILLYGGGHKGFYSNESRVVRHCLYSHFPTAFFFIQSNNEVDEKNDLIIARGPHPILGQPKGANVRIQPYPTIIEHQIERIVQPERRKDKIIVSAITGVRMDMKMAEQSDSDMRAFFGVLDKSPGAVWHFIGAADPAALVAANPHIAARVKSGQVMFHPVLPMEEFVALVSKAALFLHLPGFTGGSGGATVARRAGVPILTFRHSDVSGRQPPETVFEASNAAGFAAMAVKLLQDGDLWVQIVNRQFDHTHWILETSAQGFYDCLTEAYQSGIVRIDVGDGPVVPLRPSA
jgi:hypothetical protein